MDTTHNAVTAGPVTPTNCEAGCAHNAPAPEKFEQTKKHFADDEASRKGSETFVPCLRCVGDLLRRIGGAA